MQFYYLILIVVNGNLSFNIKALLKKNVDFHSKYFAFHGAWRLEPWVHTMWIMHVLRQDVVALTCLLCLNIH